MKGKKEKKNTNKKNRNSKRINPKKSKKKSVKKSVKKNQQGGGIILPAIGIGLAATAVAATAYKGFRMISKVRDKSDIKRLLNKDYIEYSPKVIVSETKDFINHYSFPSTLPTHLYIQLHY